MARLVNDEYEDLVCEYTVLDCRYPYEYDAGHIKVIMPCCGLRQKFLPSAVGTWPVSVVTDV